MASKKQLEIQDNVSGMMDKFFSVNDQKPQEAPGASKQSKPKKTPARQRKAAAIQSNKSDKVLRKVFSFWADVDSQEEWRVYAKAKGMTVSDLGTKALQEYMTRHKLTGNQQQIYDLYLDKK